MSHRTHLPDERASILIVGAGPAGMTAALSLARLGVHSILLTRYPSTAHTPRAHVINQRTMEIFRSLGVEDRVQAAADDQRCMENNPWVTTLAGTEVARITAWGNGIEHQRYADASPSVMCNYPQHLLEPILMDAIHETGLVDVRFGHEYLDHEQTDHDVVSYVRVRDSGREYTVVSEYLIGADGARSTILEQLGIEPEGLSDVGQAVFVWIEADLARYVEHRPGILYHSIIPDGRAGLILVRPWDEWIAGIPVDGSIDAGDHDALISRVHEFIGDTSVPVKIKAISAWSINANSAPRYSLDRVFCMGDAVHRHLPWNGLGLNTGVADAYNLAWKLKLVLDGTADGSLLGTYDTERAPVGRQVINRVTQTTMQMFAVPTSIGNNSGLSTKEMLRNTDTLFTDTADGADRRRRLDAALDPLRTTGFNALGAEIGYRYRHGAVIPDGTPEPLPDGDPDYAYRATTWPGARLPHAWIESGRAQISTLDLVRDDRFTLFLGNMPAARRDAVSDLDPRLATAVASVQVGGTSGIRDVYGTWARLREVADDGAVLARPDRHVAWRSNDSTGATDLAAVLQQLVAPPAE